MLANRSEIISILKKGFNNTEPPPGPLAALAVRGQHVGSWGDSTLPVVRDKTYTWQQCSVTISEDMLKTKYDFDLR